MMIAEDVESRWMWNPAVLGRGRGGIFVNSERLAQHPSTEKVPEAVRDEVGIVVAAFPARDRHGEEDESGDRRPKRRGPCRGGADGGREGDVAPTEAVRPHRAAQTTTARLDTVEYCGDDGQRPDAQRRTRGP